MKNFVDDFTRAFDITLLGLYQKKKSLENQEIYSGILKKGLDIFCYLNYKYNLIRADDSYILPTHETELIRTFEKPMCELIETLPNTYRQQLYNSKLAQIDALVAIGSKHTYYLLQEAYELLERREFFKSKDNKSPEFEYLGQKLYESMVSKNQNDYEHIRWFLQQKKNVYLSTNIIYQNDEQEHFIKEFKEIVDAAYELLPRGTKTIKLCPVCGMVLRENEARELHCVSEYCRKQSKGFLNVKEINIADTEGPIMVLNDIVAHNIYYPGQLEIRIADILERNEIKYIKYPNMDEWDFEVSFTNADKWFIDAKVVENPYWIKVDIEEKEKTGIVATDNILYVVPNARTNTYLNSIRRNILNKERIQCVTLKEFEELLIIQKEVMDLQ